MQEVIVSDIMTGSMTETRLRSAMNRIESGLFRYVIQLAEKNTADGTLSTCNKHGYRLYCEEGIKLKAAIENKISA
jgi:hypothetical protein